MEGAGGARGAERGRPGAGRGRGEGLHCGALGRYADLPRRALASFVEHFVGRGRVRLMGRRGGGACGSTRRCVRGSFGCH